MNLLGISAAQFRASRQVLLECYHDGERAELADCASAWQTLTERYPVASYADLAKLVNAVFFNFRDRPHDAALVAEGHRVLWLVWNTLGGVPCAN